ncbi:MAG: DUF1343 domain-containing protein [Subdoligranulum sp.]|nr:DUF1343 domain-containing protein [Subdoligranulum sp.]
MRPGGQAAGGAGPPRPAGRRIIEGTTLRPGMESFVGCYPLPTRYALTIGEFAQMVNAEQHFGCDLTVVPCTGWQRGQSAPAWGTPWIMPSPNIPNYETALLYVGTCLFEGTNVSEGRGTAAPFAVIGAPYIHDAEALAAAFNARGLPGICATPYYFTPTFSKHQGQLCGGVHLHVLDADAVRPLSAGLTLLELIRDTCPKDFVLLPRIPRAAALYQPAGGPSGTGTPGLDGGGAYQSPGPGRSRLCRPQSGLPLVLTRCFYAYIARNDPAGKTGPAIGRGLSGVRAAGRISAAYQRI